MSAIGAGAVSLATSASLAALWFPGRLFVASGEGVPRIVPYSVSIALTLGALAVWQPRRPFAELSAFWAVGAACFARPTLKTIGLTTEWMYPLLVILALMLADFATAPLTADLRAPFVAAAGAMAVSILALAIGTTATDFLAYAGILVACGLSLNLSRRCR